MLGSRRDQFHVPRDVHYLNCAYMSPLLRSVEEAGIEGVRRKRLPVDLTPDDFFDDSDAVRRGFAGLIGSRRPDRVALVPAVSYGAAIVARNLELRSGDNVVLAGEQFPSNVYPWTAMAREAGAEVRTVDRPAPDDASDPRGIARRWNELLLDSMDHDTALVALPQAHWTDGTLFDLEIVGDRAREVGAALVVDGTQTVGAHPFDVDEVRPDALVCAGYKWLLGPYGLGLTWLGDRFIEGAPVEETWIGRRGSEDFGGLVDYEAAYREDASRFDVGERSSFILVPMLLTALEQLRAWGIDAVADRCRRLTTLVARGARELGYGVLPDAERCSNIVGLGVPGHVDLERLVEGLRSRDVHVSRRGSSLRVSPHVYNDDADVEALLGVLQDAV
ncbi:MAG: aminotransferase class V-fold PLP-dependent enzyme [Gemmatimonadota bacterium]